MRMAGTALPSIGAAITAKGAGKVLLPVSRSSYMYSHFRYVAGSPAPDGSRGVSITKLKILDVLISQLSQMKKKPEVEVSTLSPSDDRIDAMIYQYKTQIKTAQAASQSIPYAIAPAAASGALFSISA